MSHASNIEPKLISLADTAILLGVPERTVRTWVRTGVLHPVRIGGRVLLRREDIDRMISGQPAT